MKRLILLLATALIVAGAGNYITAQQSGSGVPGGSAYSTQYKSNSTTFGGAGPGSAGQVLTSNGAGAAPTFQASGAPTGAALTRTSDTNVTLTLGGSPTTALLNATSITAGWTGTLAAARGGTDGASPTDDSLMVGSGTAWVTKALTSCSGASSAVTYNTTTNAFGCNTISSGGSPGGADTNVQYNNSSAFGGSAAFTWNDSTHKLLIGNQATPPTFGTVVTTTVGTAMTIAAGDCSSSGCSPAALTIRGGEGAGSAVGSNVTVRGGNGNGAAGGGAATLKGGDGSSGGQGGLVALTAGNGASAAGGRINLTSGTGSSSGTITVTTGSVDRITLTGSASASTGIQFNGYGAGTLVTDSSGNVTATGIAITSGTFAVTYPNCCSTTPTQNWAFTKITNGTTATCTVYPTDIVSATGDATSFNTSGGTVIPSAERPIQAVTLDAGGAANAGVNGSSMIQFATNGNIFLGSSAFDINATWVGSGNREWPATNLGLPTFTYRCTP